MKITRRELLAGIGAAAAVVAVGMDVNAAEPPEDAEEYHACWQYIDRARMKDAAQKAAEAPLKLLHEQGYKHFKMTGFTEGYKPEVCAGYILVSFKVW